MGMSVHSVLIKNYTWLYGSSFSLSNFDTSLVLFCCSWNYTEGMQFFSYKKFVLCNVLVS